jgi:hypothetical protein
MITALAGAFLVERRYFIYAGSAKPFQVSRPKAVVYLRNYYYPNFPILLPYLLNLVSRLIWFLNN